MVSSVEIQVKRIAVGKAASAFVRPPPFAGGQKL
jgi:hypothetical protein